MLATPHLLTGAVIGVLVGSFPAAIVLAFLSHFILDAVPHTEVSTFRPINERDIDDPEVDRITYRLAFIDLALGSTIFLLLLSAKANYVFALVGAGTAVLPDIINHIPWWKRRTRTLPVFKQFYQLHRRIHYQLPTKYWPYGVITQVVVVALAIWILQKY